MNEEAILEAIRELARDKLAYHGTLVPEMRLVEDLELDSIRLLTLAMAVEDRFRICLDEDDEAALETVGDLVAVIAAKSAAAGLLEEAEIEDVETSDDEILETVEIEPVEIPRG